MNTYNVIWLDQLGINDIDTVGGKNASLGEMIQNLGNGLRFGYHRPDALFFLIFFGLNLQVSGVDLDRCVYHGLVAAELEGQHKHQQNRGKCDGAHG